MTDLSIGPAAPIEPNILIALDDDFEVLQQYVRLFAAADGVQSRRLVLRTFTRDEDAVRFVAENAGGVLGYIQDLLRKDFNDSGALEGIEFLQAVIRPLTPTARVIIRSAVPHMAIAVVGSDPNVRLISKDESEERLAQLIEWLIEPPPPRAENSSGLVRSIAPLVQVVSTPWPEIRRRISMNPNELHRLPPRKFEELIAEVYRDYGWEVDLTATTRDGGYDIIAVRRNAPGELKVLIEAKRYDPTNKVGVGIVRSLYGVRQVRHASQVVLATSSYVSEDAKREFQHVIPHELGIMERDEIIEWCRQAGQVTLTGFAEG